MAQETRIEVRRSKTRKLYRAEIIEVGVQGGHTKAILCKLESEDYESLQWQIEGALKQIDNPNSFDELFSKIQRDRDELKILCANL